MKKKTCNICIHKCICKYIDRCEVNKDTTEFIANYSWDQFHGECPYFLEKRNVYE